TCMASRSPPAIRPISTSSDVACIASDGRLVRLVAGERHRVHRSATIVTDAHTAFVPPPGGNPKRFGPQKCVRLGTSRRPLARRFCHKFNCLYLLAVGSYRIPWPPARPGCDFGRGPVREWLTVFRCNPSRLRLELWGSAKCRPATARAACAVPPAPKV